MSADTEATTYSCRRCCEPLMWEVGTPWFRDGSGSTECEPMLLHVAEAHVPPMRFPTSIYSVKMFMEGESRG